MRVIPLVPLFVLIPTFAVAQPAGTPPPPPTGAPITLVAPAPMERHGLFGGGGLWGGNISCEGDCGDEFREAGGASGHIGYMLTPRFGLLFDFWAMTSSKNDVKITYAIGTVGARYYLAPILWVQGSVGNGHAIVSVGPFGARGDDVPVGQLAAGFEIVRGKGWALDLTAKVAQGSTTDDADGASTGRAVGIGASVSLFQRRPRM